MPLSGAMMIGVSQTVENGVTRGFEYLRLEPRSDGVFYVAVPSGKTETAFRFEGETVDKTLDRERRGLHVRQSQAGVPATDFLPARQGRLAVRVGRGQGQRRRTQGHLSDAPDQLRIGRIHLALSAMPPPSALETFEKLLAAGKDGALLRFSLGNEHLKAGDAPSAALHLARAVAQDPDFTAAWKLYGKALAAAGRNDEALAAYRTGMEVAARRGDKQAEKEMRVFARRLEK